jgi:hypothetical protein
VIGFLHLGGQVAGLDSGGGQHQNGMDRLMLNFDVLDSADYCKSAGYRKRVEY